MFRKNPTDSSPKKEFSETSDLPAKLKHSDQPSKNQIMTPKHAQISNVDDCNICYTKLVHNEPIESIQFSSFPFNKINANALFRTLCDNSTVTKLMISDSTLDDSHVESIVKLIQKNKHLEQLTIRLSGLATYNICDIAKSLYSRYLSTNTNKTLKTLDLSYNSIGKDAVKDLSIMLANNETIRELYLANCDLTDEDVILLAEGLKHNKSLLCIHLLGNILTDKSVEFLLEALKTNETLHQVSIDVSNPGLKDQLKRKLDYNLNEFMREKPVSKDDMSVASSNRINQANDLKDDELTALYSESKICLKAVKATPLRQFEFNMRIGGVNRNYSILSHAQAIKIAGILKENNNITSLNLSDCNIDDAKLEVICKGLENCTTLESIDLSFNQIRYKRTTMEALYRVVSHNKKLVKIDLSFNNINSLSAEYIWRMIYVNPSILELNLAGNRISNDSIDLLMNVLKQNKKLHTLNLSHNEIESAGTIKILDALNHNKTLLFLNLSSNELNPEKMLPCLKKFLQSNPGLLTLEMSQCFDEDMIKNMEKELATNSIILLREEKKPGAVMRLNK